MPKGRTAADLAHIEAVILDMDGVLVNTEPIHILSFRKFLSDINIPVTSAFLHSLVGHSVEDNIITINNKFLKAQPLPLKNAVVKREKIYLKLLHKASLTARDGIAELVNFCNRYNKKLALASSSSREQIEEVLSGLNSANSSRNWQHIFDVIVSGDDVQFKKPAADIYLLTTEKLNIRSKNCLAIEDSPAGVQSAVAAGVICAGLINEFAADAALSQADILIQSIDEVVHMLSDHAEQ